MPYSQYHYNYNKDKNTLSSEGLIWILFNIHLTSGVGSLCLNIRIIVWAY